MRLIWAAEPVLQQWLKDRSKIICCNGSGHGYFRGRDGNEVWSSIRMVTVSRRRALRQRSGNRYCIAIYRDLDNGRPTDVPHAAVTMANRPCRAQRLFEADSYSDYLYFHGLAVWMAEALAEWTHARIRRECGFADARECPCAMFWPVTEAVVIPSVTSAPMLPTTAATAGAKGSTEHG